MDVPVWVLVVGVALTSLGSFALGCVLTWSWLTGQTGRRAQELADLQRDTPPAHLVSTPDGLRELSLTERGYWRHVRDGSTCASYPDSLRFTYVASSIQCSHGVLRCYRAEELALLNEEGRRASGAPEPGGRPSWIESEVE